MATKKASSTPLPKKAAPASPVVADGSSEETEQAPFTAGSDSFKGDVPPQQTVPSLIAELILPPHTSRKVTLHGDKHHTLFDLHPTLPSILKKPSRRRGLSATATPGPQMFMASLIAAPNKPAMTFKQSPNFNSRGNYKPVAIVDHIMQGTLQSSNSEFMAAGTASTHFGVGSDGTIFQWVDLDQMAWGNGLAYENDGRPYIDVPVGGGQVKRVYESPDRSVPWLADALDKRANPNLMTISIEHAGNSGGPFPEAMYQATLALHRWLLLTYNIPATRDYIIGHNQIQPKNRGFCPGTGFPWARLMSDLGGFSLTKVEYMASVPTVAMVRPGPGRSYEPSIKKAPGADKQFKVSGEAKGEVIWDDRLKRMDDTWAYFEDLDGAKGFVSRSALIW